MTLIVGFRHADEALRFIPQWWGVQLVAVGRRGGIHFHSARAPKNNPDVAASAVVQFLWRDEALQILSELGAATGINSKTRREIHSKLIQCADLEFTGEDSTLFALAEGLDLLGNECQMVIKSGRKPVLCSSGFCYLLTHGVDIFVPETESRPTELGPLA